MFVPSCEQKKMSKDSYSDDDELFDENEVYGGEGDVKNEEIVSNSAFIDQELIVEKVLGRKILNLEDGNSEELFYVKWKGLSYLHASWERREDIEQVDLNGKLKLKRFLQTPQLPGILGEPTELRTYDDDENPPEDIIVEDGEVEADIAT